MTFESELIRMISYVWQIIEKDRSFVEVYQDCKGIQGSVAEVIMLEHINNSLEEYLIKNNIPLPKEKENDSG